MYSLSSYLHGPDNLILRADVAVEDLCDLVPAGLDGGADSIYLLQASLVCWWWRYEVLLVGEPPEDRWQVLMIVLVCRESLTVGFNLIMKYVGSLL